MLNDYKQRSIETITNVIERVGAAFDVESPYAQSEAIARLSEAFKDIAEAPDVPASVIKATTYIKSDGLCETCKHAENCRMLEGCDWCEMGNDDGTCKCDKIPCGKPCAHYIPTDNNI